MRALVLFIEGTWPTADVLPTLCLIVIAVGVAQAATGGIGPAVLIIPPLQEGLWSEMFLAGIISDDGDATSAS